MSACGSTPKALRPLASGEVAESAAGHSIVRRHRASLAYHARLTARHLVTVELTHRFFLMVRSRDSGKTIRSIELDTPDWDVRDLVVSADGARAFVASSAGWVRSYDLARGEMQHEWRMGSGATALALSSDEAFLLVGTETGVLCLRRLRDGAQLQCLVGHSARVSSLRVHGDRVASGSWDGDVAVWDLPSLRALQRFSESDFVTAIAWSPNGKTLAVARSRRKPVRTPELNRAEKTSAKLDPETDHRIELLSPGQSQAPSLLIGHRSVISSIAWLGSDLVSTSWDRTVRIWNTKSSGAVRILLTLAHLGSDIGVFPASGDLAIASWAPSDDDASVTEVQLLYPKR